MRKIITFSIASLMLCLLMACGGGSNGSSTTDRTMEKDAKEMAKLFYDYDNDKITDAQFEEVSKTMEEKYKEKEMEFRTLFVKELVELTVSKNDFESAIYIIEDYIDTWEWDIEDLPIAKTNELIKHTQDFISKVNDKKEQLTPNEIEDLKEVEKQLQEIINEIKKLSSTTASSNSCNDWDAVLEKYEDYIDQYIKLLKKANQGDMSALTEYANMMEKATDLAEELEDADELTSTQAAKFAKLQTKLLNAALELQ